MTHPTIEKMAVAIDEATDNSWAGRMVIDDMRKEQAKAAARVILAAEPSEAEIEAALDDWADGRFDWRLTEKDARTARQHMARVLKARDAAKAKEMGL